MTHGRGVILQRNKSGDLSDAKAFRLADGLSWRQGERTRTETNLSPWRGTRGAAGRLAPRLPALEPVRVESQRHDRLPVRRFSLFLLFFQEIISERQLVLRRNPRFLVAQRSEKTAKSLAVFFAVSRCSCGANPIFTIWLLN